MTPSLSLMSQVGENKCWPQEAVRFPRRTRPHGGCVTLMCLWLWVLSTPLPYRPEAGGHGCRAMGRFGGPMDTLGWRTGDQLHFSEFSDLPLHQQTVIQHSHTSKDCTLQL